MTHPTFRALYDQLSDHVADLAFKLLGSRAEAEEVAQEVFLSVSRALGTFRGDASPRTWVSRIAVNACLRQLERRRARPEEPAADFEELVRQAGPGPRFGPEEAALAAEVLDCVRDGCFTALAASLPFEQRVVFVLVQMLDWTVEDAAGLLEITPGAVKARLHRAREAMAAFFDRKCGRLDSANPCTCRSRVGVTLRFDPDLLKRARARLAGRAPDAVPPRPETILEIVRQIPELRLDEAPRRRFFGLLEGSGPDGVS